MKRILFLLIVCGFLTSCKDHNVRMFAEPTKAPVGSKGTVTIKLTAHGKWHIDPKSLVNIAFQQTNGIKFDKESLTSEDRGENNVFKTGFTVEPTAPKGVTTIKADVFFMICSKELCKIIRETHETSFNVN